MSSLRFRECGGRGRLDQDKRLAWRLQARCALQGDDWRTGAPARRRWRRVGARVVYLPYTPSSVVDEAAPFCAPTPRTLVTGPRLKSRKATEGATVSLPVVAGCFVGCSLHDVSCGQQLRRSRARGCSCVHALGEPWGCAREALRPARLGGLRISSVFISVCFSTPFSSSLSRLNLRGGRV